MNDVKIINSKKIIMMRITHSTLNQTRHFKWLEPEIKVI